MRRASPLLLQRREHLAAQDRVDARLVAAALPAQPRQHVGIDANRRRSLGRPVVFSANRLPSCDVGQHRDVARVDVLVGQRLKGCKFSLLCIGQGRQVGEIDVEANELRLRIFFSRPVRLCGPR